MGLLYLFSHSVWIIQKSSFAAKQPFKARVFGTDLSNAYSHVYLANDGAAGLFDKGQWTSWDDTVSELYHCASFECFLVCSNAHEFSDFV